jgi:hypothetical protein
MVQEAFMAPFVQQFVGHKLRNAGRLEVGDLGRGAVMRREI